MHEQPCLKVKKKVTIHHMKIRQVNISIFLGPGATPTDDFAAKVAGKLLGSPPRYITYGAKSLAFLLFYYLPFFVKDFVLKRMLGVNEVKRVK